MSSAAVFVLKSCIAFFFSPSRRKIFFPPFFLNECDVFSIVVLPFCSSDDVVIFFA